jgi:enterochelin esterase family protein
MKTYSFAILLFAAGVASSVPAQEDGIQDNRTAMLQNAPSVSKDGKVTFKLTAAKASADTLNGDWGGARTPMTRDDKGTWTATLQLRPQIYSYTFLVDGVRTLDPANPQLKIGRVVNASSVEVPGTTPMPWEMRDVAHGQITTITYRSTAAGDQRRVVIYTPPGYEPDQAAKLPVLYLLHGVGEIESSWVQYGRANLIADSLLAEGQMKPMIIVMPNGHAYKPGETAKTDAQRTSVFQEDLLETIVPLVERSYRVKTDQPNRAVMGLSMGGRQALNIGLGHLDRFSHVGIFSASGSRGTDVLARLTADPTSASAQLKLLWIGCGRSDPRFAEVLKLTDDLTKAGIHHTFQASDGAHDWINWRAYLTQTLPLLFN